MDGLDDDDVGGQTVVGAKYQLFEEPSATPCVHILTGSAAGAFMAVPIGVTVIGRSPTAGLRFEDAGISRNHASLRTDETGRAWLKDLASSNGTFLNKRKVAAEEQLRDGDNFQIGFTTVLQYVLEVLPEATLDDSPETRDPVTGGYTRPYLLGRLASELGLAERRQLRLAVLVLAPRHLDQLSQAHGPGVRDAALAALAEAIRAAEPIEEVIARYREDRLVMVLRACGLEAGRGLARRLAKAIGALPFVVNGRTLTTEVSVRAAALEDGHRTAEALLDAADAALAEA